MKTYNKQEVDTIFSSWQDDLDQLDVIEAVPLSVLDKIRAEIEGKYRIVLKDIPNDDLTIKRFQTLLETWNECLDEVLEVIDKYKAESEPYKGGQK